MTIVKVACIFQHVLIIGLGFGLAPQAVLAQLSDIEGYIVYVKQWDDDKEYIYASSDITSSLTVSEDQCAAISPDGAFLGISPLDGGELTVYALRDKRAVLTQDLPADQQPCNFGWSTGDVLNIAEDHLRLTFSNGEFAIQALESEQTADLSLQLPNRVPSEAILPSPDGMHVLYNQCPAGNVSVDETFCIRDASLVIYNSVEGEVIETLQDANVTILPDDEPVPNLAAAYWSPSGRYLLYFTTGSEVTQPIQVYDVRSDSYIALDLPSDLNVLPLTAGFQWTSDESSVGFWSTDEQTSSSNLSFAVLNLVTGELNQTSQFFSVDGAINWRWSPDNQSIAFVNQSSHLIRIDLDSEEQVLVDEAVSRIVTWSR